MFGKSVTNKGISNLFWSRLNTHRFTLCCIAAIVFALPSFVQAQTPSNQDDRSFRVFGEDLTPTPNEISHVLSGLRLKDQPENDFNEALMEQLEEASGNLLEQLDDEQKEIAQDLARRAFSGDSISEQDKKAFLDLLGPNEKSSIEKLMRKYKDYEENKEEIRQFDAARLMDQARKQFDRSRRKGVTDNGSAQEQGNADSQSNRNDKSRSDLDRRNSGDRNLDEQARRNQIDDKNSQSQSGKDGRLSDIEEMLKKAKGMQARDSNGGEMANGTSGRSGGGRVNDGGLSKAQQQRKFAERIEEMKRLKETRDKNIESGGLDGGFPFEIGGDESESGQSLKEADGSSKKADERTKRSEKNSSESRESFSENSTKNLQELIKLVNEENEANGVATEGKKDGLAVGGQDKGEDAKKSPWNFFKKQEEKQEGKLDDQPKERLATRFDRLMVDAAKKAIRSKAKSLAESKDSKVGDSVDSVFDSVIDRVQDSIKKKKRAEARRNEGARSGGRSGNRGRGRQANSELAVNDRSTMADRASRAGSDSGGGFLDSLSESVESKLEAAANTDLEMPDIGAGIPDIANLNWKAWLTILASLGLIGMIAYILWQNVGPEHADRKRMRRRGGPIATIRSPKDLVEAFDDFLLDTFGYRSDWWNANHAARVIGDQAPEYKGKIGDLVHDYVEARYSPTVTEYSSSEQRDHTETLKELTSRELSSSDQLDDDKIIPTES